MQLCDVNMRISACGDVFIRSSRRGPSVSLFIDDDCLESSKV